MGRGREGVEKGKGVVRRRPCHQKGESAQSPHDIDAHRPLRSVRKSLALAG